MKITMMEVIQAYQPDRYVAMKQAIAAYRHGWHVAASGGMLCDCVDDEHPVMTPDMDAGWRVSSSEEVDAAMRKCEVR